MEYRVIKWSEWDTAQQSCAVSLARQVAEKSDRHPRFATEADRRRHEAGVWLAYHMVSERLGCDIADLRWAEERGGKPYFEDCAVSFSVSHAGDYVLCAVHDTPVGADIEVRRAVRPLLIERVAQPAEAAYITAVEAERDARFLAVWTAKEAYVKYTGQGLTAGLSSVTVADENGLLPQVNGHTLHSVTADAYTIALVY